MLNKFFAFENLNTKGAYLAGIISVRSFSIMLVHQTYPEGIFRP
jgi:hypothetical protein